MKTRRDEEMLSVILDTARNDDRILAVVMAGSRADQSNPKDIFMDFDIEYVVNDVSPFKNNLEWAKRFGDPMIIQMPNHLDYDDLSGIEDEVYLMQFLDGTRIDLTIETLEVFNKKSQEEPAVVLYDPENILPELPVPDGSCYFIKQPSKREFDLCCNEYWWLHPYFAKEMWRGNTVLAHKWLNENIRPMLIRMIGWQVGYENNWQKSIGKYGKFLRSCLTAQEWEQLMGTYTDAEPENVWAALAIMDEIFCKLSEKLGEAFGFYYYKQESENVKEYLRHVQTLPKDAKRIYDN